MLIGTRLLLGSKRSVDADTDLGQRGYRGRAVNREPTLDHVAYRGCGRPHTGLEISRAHRTTGSYATACNGADHVEIPFVQDLALPATFPYTNKVFSTCRCTTSETPVTRQETFKNITES